jgi:hypothetical protein
MNLKERLETAAAIPPGSKADNAGASLLRSADARKLLALVEAAHYAAGSFAQVPADKTVPPIVLHDCKEHLETALAALVQE